MTKASSSYERALHPDKRDGSAGRTIDLVFLICGRLLLGVNFWFLDKSRNEKKLLNRCTTSPMASAIEQLSAYAARLKAKAAPIKSRLDFHFLILT